jgi:GNAT superfamily N-acetyltransferase
MARESIEFHPATAARWRDVEKLFGPRGACAGCWCMWARLPRAEYHAGLGARNKRALKRIVASDTPPGILAYVNGEPAGWCGLGPRADFQRLANSKILAPVDDRPAWSVVCFFVARQHRRRGLSVRLLREAVRHAGAHGATLIEGYPTDSRSRAADAFVWTGLASAFERAGFREVARRSRTRPIMRRAIRGGRRAARSPGGRARG